MKKYFLTGTVIVLPLALTIVIIGFLINLLTDPFIDVVRGIFERYGLLEQSFLFLSAGQLQRIVSQVLILIILFFGIVGIGMLARWFFFHTLIRLGDYIFHQIPVVRSIYKTAKDVINTMFASNTRSFKQVVMVPYPNPETYAIGLVTREELPIGDKKTGENLVAVFVPTTPNPTSGFLVIYKQSDIIYLDMTVEEAFKSVISCGVIMTPFHKVSKQESDKIIESETHPKGEEGEPV